MCLAEETQSLIVSFGALPHLHSIITTAKQETLAAAVACVRNLSILHANEVSYLGGGGGGGRRRSQLLWPVYAICLYFGQMK